MYKVDNSIIAARKHWPKLQIIFGVAVLVLVLIATGAR